jgi:hypothetical protein
MDNGDGTPSRKLLDLIDANLGPLQNPRTDAASFPPGIQSLEFDGFLPDATDTLRDAVRVGRRGISHTARIFLSKNNALFLGPGLSSAPARFRAAATWQTPLVHAQRLGDAERVRCSRG